MKQRRYLFTVLAFFLIASILFAPQVAQAGTSQYSGSTVGAAQWNRPFADGSCCSTLGPVTYVTMPICVDTAGTYSFSSVQDGWDGYLLLYVSPFDPLNQTVNFVAGDDDGNGGIGTSDFDASMDADVEYTVVTTAFEIGEEGTFTNTISGPGNILIGGCQPEEIVTDGCLLVVPAGSVVGDAPFETQVFYEPGNISPGVVLNPGTYIVIGQDESETYYKVMLACKFVWVRKDTMQPSYQPPQNGAPLPTTIVG